MRKKNTSSMQQQKMKEKETKECIEAADEK